ncbi:hypothetical protein [Brevundimonas sp.]|uniref:hypothetical protein n=1 Tax=Brevundimonas sp. TaxID=1871086 RepID=UPI0027F43B5C|nr:hypothetical protein [Brevundimonas sp.]MDQ7814119.1 hypothetical protein [Brevundimonas sp.]
MPRPDMSIIAQQLQMQRASIIAAFKSLSGSERMAQASSYAEAEAEGQAIFHPFHLCFDGARGPVQ